MHVQRNHVEDPRREQIVRILHSETFRDRDALKRLLIYLADRTFDGGAEALKEYTIGVEVFGKSEHYDPQKDASVRQYIGKLRQKLEEYYRSEGASDPISIELPKRQFRLLFNEGPQAIGVRRPRIATWAVTACLLALLPLAYWLGSRRHASGPAVGVDPAVRTVWAPFLDSSKPTVMCLGTPLFLRYRSLRLRQSHVNALEDPEAQAWIEEQRKRLGIKSLVPSFDYTGIGEAFAAIRIAEVFGRERHDLAITRSDALSWNEIKNGNVVFLGPPKFNPHLAGIPAKLEFTVGSEQVINVHPQAGEPATYDRVNDANVDAIEDYVLISRLPSIDPSCRILILDGLSTASTWAAADYITHPATAREIVSKLKSRDGSIPTYFQALLHVKYRALVPTETSFVTYRVLKP